MSTRKRIEWRLLVAMSKKRIRKTVDLQRMLADYGVNISSQQLGRLVAGCPHRLNMELLEALVNVLDCGIGDLLVLVEDGPGDPANDKGGAPAPRAASRSAPKARRIKGTVFAEAKSVPAPPDFRVIDPIPKEPK